MEEESKRGRNNKDGSDQYLLKFAGGLTAARIENVNSKFIRGSVASTSGSYVQIQNIERDLVTMLKQKVSWE